MPGFGAGGELAIGQVTTGTFTAEFIGPDKWMRALSEPVRTRRGVPAGAQQFTSLPDPFPFVSFSWFAPLSSPVRVKPGLRPGAQQFTAYVPNPTTVTPFAWFAPLSTPVRTRPGLAAARQQFLAAPSRLLPKPNIFGTLAALETKDVFLAGASKFNPAASAEIGIVAEVDFAAEIGVAVPAVARVAVSIIVSS